MKTNTIDIQVLKDKAKASEPKESYVVLDKNKNCKVCVGAKVSSSDTLSFFIEVIICFRPISNVDTKDLEKNLRLLKELELRGYTLSWGDDSCIYCENEIIANNMNSEYDNIRSMINE
jgi:hypothetical protein